MSQRFVIVGGGAAGTLVGLSLAQLAKQQTDIVIIEPRSRLGEGVAYSTTNEAHLLNVPAIGMSAYLDDTSHFVRWANCQESAFVPRHRYADYLRNALATEVANNPLVRLHHHTSSAQAISVNPLRVADGTQQHAADAVVLALGNATPTRPEWLVEIAPARVIDDPWASDALDAVPDNSRVLCIGTGLTFVDVALALTRRGCRVVGTSRHGLLPTEHAQSSDVIIAPPTMDTPSAILRWLRTQHDWRAAFAALRPDTQRLWQQISVRGQQQFLRHARRYWDVHRHRMAPEVAAQLFALQQDGKIHISRDDARTLAISNVFDRIVLCTGPDDAFALTAAPLASLVANGHARPGPHGMGIDTAIDTGHVLDAHGIPVHNLYAIGPLRRGTLWESTAIPEIRSQAHQLAMLLLV